MKLYQNNTKIAYSIFWLSFVVSILLDLASRKLFNYKFFYVGSATVPAMTLIILLHLFFLIAAVILFISCFYYKPILYRKWRPFWGVVIFLLQAVCNYALYTLILLEYIF